MTEKLLLIISAKSFIVLVPTFRSLIHFEFFSLIWCEVKVRFHSFACGYPVDQHPVFEKTILSPFSGLGTMAENQLPINVRVHLYVLNYFLLICMFILMPV